MAGIVLPRLHHESCWCKFCVLERSHAALTGQVGVHLQPSNLSTNAAKQEAAKSHALLTFMAPQHALIPGTKQKTSAAAADM